MAVINFQGFGGVQLSAETFGIAENPSVLLLHGGCQTREVWRATAHALVKAGRYVINLDLRGHGESEKPADKRYDFACFVADLKAVLAQIDSRPVIIAGPLGGWIATVALSETSVPLASGLILADSPTQLERELANKEKERFLNNAKLSADISWDPAFVETFDSEAALSQLDVAAAKLKVPTLYVRGQASEYTSSQSVKSFLSLMDDAESFEIDRAGHQVTDEHLDTFNAVVVDFIERKAPRFRPDYTAGEDPRVLRDAMGCFATGVAVVTAMSSDDKPVGLTVNSFSSVSLTPALILVCIAHSVSSLEILQSEKHFAVNILHMGQQPTSDLFARPSEDRFAKVAWQPGDNDAPILTNSLASIECSQHAIYDGGDHIILVGHVDRVRFDPRRDPLLYFSGKYRRLHLG